MTFPRQTALTRAIGARKLSRGLYAQWSDMDHEAIMLWLSEHGEEGERLHKELMAALLNFGVWIKETHAHERRGAFDIERYVNESLNGACNPLAPEVREWLGS